MSQKKPKSKKAPDAAEIQSSERRKRREGTLAWLTDILVDENGETKAKEALQQILVRNFPGYPNRTYKLDSEGEQVYRTDAMDDKWEVFREFSPPGTWTPPYSLLKVKFLPNGTRNRLISHLGEEILIPTSGQIDYVFLRKQKEGLVRELVSESESGPLGAGDVIRVQPSVPHYTWAHGDKEAEAWMLIRDISGNLASVRSKTKKNDGVSPHHHDREHFENNPENYPMYAWGIAEKISYFRAAADMEIFNLANRLGIDRAQVSRIESGGTNLGLLRMILIGAELGFDALEGLTENLWVNERGNLPTLGGNEHSDFGDELACRSDWRPLVSAKSLELKAQQEWPPKKKKRADEETQVNDENKPPTASISSWLMLKGSAFLNTTSSHDNYLSEGSVFHVRSPEEVIKIVAHTPAQLIRFECQILKGSFPTSKKKSN